MRKIDIENKVIQIVERIEAKQPIEDDLVELKSTWPSADRKTARQLAGHANAARGDDILWLIGIDEKTGLVGANFEELSNWFNSVNSHFEDDMVPTLTSINVPLQGKTVVALLFNTDRAPFLIKTDGSGPVTRDVPWREGNSTRSARRSDLIRLLLPIQQLPFLEVLTGNIFLNLNQGASTDPESYDLFLFADLYITPMSDLLVIPFHRCSAEIQFDQAQGSISLQDFRLSAPSGWAVPSFQTIPHSVTLQSTPNEIVVSAPGLMNLRAIAHLLTRPNVEQESVNVTIKMRPDPNSEHPIVITCTFKRKPKPGETHLAEWLLSKD